MPSPTPPRSQAFLGIPYAKPPVGALRFRPPEALSIEVPARAESHFGPPAPQRSPLPPIFRRLARRATTTPHQNCLSLNVWTPAADSARRPVLVWLHGGGFTRGASSWFVYDGEGLSRRGGVVVVTVNYRLGALGSLNTRSLGIAKDVSPNLGLRDQIAALGWVRRNIEAYGGDPENVTLAGQSAGAMSIGALLQAPEARGLFHKAILQSGAASNVLSSEQAGEIARRFLAELDLDRGSGADLADTLGSLPVHDILRAQLAVSAGNRLPLGTMAWQPSYDGELLVESPRPAEQHEIPILIGTTREEWKMFTAMDRKRRRLDDASLGQYMARTAVASSTLGEEGADEARALYERCDETGERRGASDIWVAFQTDRVFRQPAIDLADARIGSSAPTYFYRFDWQPPLARERVGACHSLDVPFTFGTLGHPMLFPLLGWSAEARRLSRQVQAAWAAFAHEGAPSCRELPEWPVYEPERRTTMLLGDRAGCIEAPGEDSRLFWKRAEQG